MWVYWHYLRLFKNYYRHVSDFFSSSRIWLMKRNKVYCIYCFWSSFNSIYTSFWKSCNKEDIEAIIMNKNKSLLTYLWPSIDFIKLRFIEKSTIKMNSIFFSSSFIWRITDSKNFLILKSLIKLCSKVLILQKL